MVLFYSCKSEAAKHPVRCSVVSYHIAGFIWERTKLDLAEIFHGTFHLRTFDETWPSWMLSICSISKQ